VSGSAADGTAERGTWRLDLAYQGTAYHGWARQPGHVTVQGLVEDALATVLRQRIALSVAGRTDAGVHAWAQVASFSCSRADLAPERLRLSLNSLLPADIAVLRVSPAAPGFVAREAVSRSYRYDVWATAVKPVRERDFVWVLRGPVDGAALRAAAGLLPGRRDFAALTPSAHLYHTCVREVTAAVWTDAGPTPDGEGRRWRFEITAGSFLHNMVRVAVGTMVDVAQGRVTLEEFEAGLGSATPPRPPRLMGQTAPARGLALVRVVYPGGRGAGRGPSGLGSTEPVMAEGG
jgi:tRNA pseudouridine38-40 synthase